MMIRLCQGFFLIFWSRRWTRFGWFRLPQSRSWRLNLGFVTVGRNYED